ncbi:DUF637 domain-containing protein [Pseudomonas sp. KU26590]|uniref:DUF637 domain-containing protein n=1 Tax=Pseudomonas sp. KU26590 TaxID=2991051 RepID=UPI0039FBE100
MNNAIASKDQLNLSVGVSLTSQQVAALTHDIVWLEEREVNGENVLVPVLYLAQADGRLAPNGALIAGKDVTLIAGQNLDNVGTLKATNNLSATAGNDLVNSGLISAGNRLDLLAGNDVINKAGGIIAGRDVTVTAIGGDVTNERSVTSLDSDVRGQLHKEYADNAARIEAANDLSVSAGRDINNIGSTLQAGRDMTLNAGRDVNTAATQLTDSLVLNSKHTSSDITQIGSTVTAGRDLSVQAGRDINAIASQIDAKRDIAMAATEDVTISSAADEEHSYSKSKKVKKQEDHVSQVQTEITAGGSVAVSAGQNLAVTSSRIAANDEAYLAAGNKLEVLAAQDNDYSLYDMKKKGSFGAKKTKHDEVTDVKNIGSEITAGGNLVLVSGGDQQYQVAKLNSGKDLTINSGGAINFEGVKDLHQESHEKSNTSLAWNSMSGKGKTDETLRQSELIAKGAVAINAVDGLHIEVKQVNQQTVSQAIDAMVKADPDLAWLKDAEKRGDVDWKLIKETHDAYKYSNSSLGQGAMLAIIIIVTALTAGVASGAVGAMASAQAGTTMAAATAATATASATTAGLGNMIATAALTSMASSAAVSVINNKGNLGATVKDITSSQSIKGYLTSAAMAGVMPGYDPASLGFNLSSAQIVLMKSASDAFVNTVINGGSYSDNLGNALVGQASNIGMAIGFKMVGDWALGKYDEGSPQKVMAHALVGGLLAEATGGDFKTGAAAAGANEALINVLSSMVGGDKQLEVMASKLTGLVAAAAVGGDVAKGAEIAQYATTYNRQLHTFEQKALVAEAQKLDQQGKSNSGMPWQTLLNFYASAEVDATDAARLKAILGTASDTNPEKLNLLDDLKTVGASISRLQSEKIALTWADGTPIIADGDKVYAFSSTSKQYADSALFSPSASGYSGDGAAAIPTDWVKQFGPGTALQYQNEIGSLSGVNIGAQGQYQQLSTLLGGGIVPLIDGDLVLGMLGGVGAKGMLALLAEKRAASVAASSKVSTGTPVWTTSEGPYSGQLTGNYPSPTATVSGQVVDGVGDLGGALGAKGSGGAIDAGFDTANLQSKLQGYLLDAGHPQNQTKATWFQQALGFDQNNWEGLASQIQFNEAKAVVTKVTQYGQTFEQKIPIVGTNGRTIDVPFVFLKDGSGIVRLVTGIPAKK